MNWITHRAPTEQDGDGDRNSRGVGYVVTMADFPYKGEFRLKPWNEVVKGEPFIPWEEPYPIAPLTEVASENEERPDRSRSKSFGGRRPVISCSVTVQLWDAVENDDHE